MTLQVAQGLLIGGVVGVSLGATGSGGSLLAIPLLVYVLGKSLQEATAMSLVVVAASAWFGVYAHYQSGEVRFRVALVFSGTGALGAWAGAYGHHLAREEILLLLFGVLMLLASAHMWRHSQLQIADSGVSCADQFPRTCWLKATSIGFATGGLSGLFGVGGGFVIVPALTLLLGFPMRTAVGTSLLIIGLISIGGIAGHLQFGSLDWVLTSLLLLGSATGMLLGHRLGRLASPGGLTKIFATVATVIALALILHNTLALLEPGI